MSDPKKIRELRKAKREWAAVPCGKTEAAFLMALADAVIDLAELRPMLDLSPAINTDNYRKFSIDKSN